MGKKKKAVIDTNVFISAFGWGGKPLKVIELLEKEHLCNCTSEEILEEICNALSYPKLGFSHKLQSNILEFILSYSVIYEPKKHIRVSPDPRDDKFIECAVSADAKLIMTGDR